MDNEALQREDKEQADNGGLRYDDGKTQFHLLPLDGLCELARVYQVGAQKYKPRNWERGMLWSRCYNSLLRHLYAYWDGERLDKETGLHHMAMVAWNALALLVYSLRGVGIDDRKEAPEKSECSPVDEHSALRRQLEEENKAAVNSIFDECAYVPFAVGSSVKADGITFVVEDYLPCLGAYVLFDGTKYNKRYHRKFVSRI